jgi:dipeptidyl aminopeptidase/acylaminoacyl peptidase
MEKTGYESDRECLTVYNRKTGEVKKLTENLDKSVDQILWAPNSGAIYFNTKSEGRRNVYKSDLKGNFELIVQDGYNSSLDISPNGDFLVMLRSYNYLPSEIFKYVLDKNSSVQLTQVNKEILSEFDLPKLEEFWFDGAEGDKVHGYIQLPPDFDPSKKYPAVLTIHGGPQNMWADRFMFTWFTFPLVSSPGYVGVFINPRGSSGYGSKFREQVSKDYGGKCYEDLMRGMDYVIDKYEFIDENKLAAIGGSFGGYSVNWIMGHTDRFKCIVSHAGLYNLISFYGATEELWFPAWDMGETPWEESELYNKWSPHNFVKNFETPTLVTHGERDYRVPFAESLQLFTALRRQGVDSRFVVFPDEGHVISKPQNNVRWWKEIHLWLDKYLH